ncbi:P-loop containing nucleoside triphosphate hydrolase protein [Xylariaceae sp. FL0255]|nr:P-loop containing nucleoside triphosphate hydrolase protein [Xylariaceae sp. FL0255]
MASPVAALQAWYGRILSRRVDLVGDYAGNELFIIEGDSLLLHCFSDPRIDFDRGYQLLHAVYCVEKFLADLKRRKCNFHIVFFDSHESLCIPPNYSSSSSSRYRLARFATIRHLERNLSPDSGILIKTFSSPFEPAFAAYMNDAGVYFVMCHDGSSNVKEANATEFSDEGATSDEENYDSDSQESNEAPMPGRSTSINAVTDDYDLDEILDLEAPGDLIDDDYTTDLASTIQDTNSTLGAESTLIDDLEGWTIKDVPMSASHHRKMAFRGLINWFILAGYNVALISDVAFVDTKVFSMILEGSSRNVTKFPEEQIRSLVDATPDLPIPTCDAFLQAVSTSSIEFSDRDFMTLAATINLLQSQDISGQEAALLVLSSVILQFVPLSARNFQTGGSQSQRTVLQKYIDSLAQLIKHNSLRVELDSKSCVCADMVDGRLLFTLNGSTVPSYLSQKPISVRFQELCSFVNSVAGADLPLPTFKRVGSKNRKQLQLRSAVLPFENPVFDKHLAPMSLKIDNEGSPMSATKSRVFRELSHWHNHKRTVAQRGEPLKLSKWALKRNQRFMAEMITYAASLTNSAGKILDPETIIASGKTAKESTGAAREKKVASEEKASNFQSQSQKFGKRPAQQGKKSNKELALEAAAARQAEKAGSKANTALNKWDKVRKELEKDDNNEMRFVKTQKHLMSLSAENAAILGPEIQLFSVKALANVWQESCDSSGSKNLGVIAYIWKICLQLQQATTGISETMRKELHTLTRQLGLPLPELHIANDSAKLPFSLSLAKRPALRGKTGPADDTNIYSIGMPSKAFQLQHCGPYFDRTIDAKPDSRVPFQPDAWQRKVLDAIDADKSLFVVAPTSAGKTFISFYAMRQVLKAGDEGVVVYVAPTKALVNQIAAEVQARFSKSFKAEARSVWGIHTRDYRINNPTGCQILVTVPHILQIMLLAPAHAEKKNSWAYRIRRIIFDEIHCIGQAEDGVIWEQLILQTSCPIIALSATVGNPKEFGQWLESTQRASGNELVMVEHTTRYSDLRKFIYNAPETFEFKGLPQKAQVSAPGLDESDAFAFVHPVAGLKTRSRGIPNDLSLEARDCLSLYQLMHKYQTADFPITEELDPSKLLPEIVRKVDVLQWETKLKKQLHSWCISAGSPSYDKVVAELQPKIKAHFHESSQETEWMSRKHSTTAASEDQLLSTTLPLLSDLQAQDALPAILFNFDRKLCEAMARRVMKTLETAETKWKETDSSWKKTVAEFEKYQKDQEKIASKTKGTAAKTTKKKGARGDDDETESKADRERGTANADGSKWSTFDPTATVDAFSFADKKKIAISDLEEYQEQLRGRGVAEWLITALNRGIGVHHAGMNRKYRQVVEILFRKGYLHVVIATGTLALGINMPCKTVVFSGDSVFLTALQYRQCAGRAGRRGFDVLGNVVFQDIDYSKVCMLLSSRLPDLNGHFPITTTLVLRLATLLHETRNSEFAIRSIDAILSQPRLVLGGPEARSAVLHHLRFSIEYLRRQDLLGPDGAPLNFAGLASHLYYTESAAWAFHALMKEGYFHALARNIHKKPKQTSLTLMLVLAHIFGRYPCRRADIEFYEQFVKRSPSVVFLPDLPSDAKKVLLKHNRETLDIFRTYVRTYAEQHMTNEVDNVLPLTGIEIGPKFAIEASESPRSLPGATVRSQFVALSGHNDDTIQTVSDLCSSVRSGIFLEEGVVPYLPVWDKDKDAPLNAYLYDFYKHGDIAALSRANRVRPGDVWFVLNDFSLVLATIVTTLMNYLKLSDSSDAEMTDLMGSGEALEEQRDDIAMEKEEAKKAKQQAAVAAPAATKRAKERVADSWESAANDMELETSGLSDDAESKTDGSGLMDVLRAFQLVREEFDAKFKNIWA